MSRTKTSVIKGRVFYEYKGRRYFDKPKGTCEVRTEWCSQDNCTTIVLRKRTMIVEITCILATIFMFVLQVMNYKVDNTLYYDSIAFTENDTFYCNIENDIGSNNSITISINTENEVIINKKVLMPGEGIYSFKCDEDIESYTIQCTYTLPISSVTKSYEVTTRKLDNK